MPLPVWFHEDLTFTVGGQVVLGMLIAAGILWCCPGSPVWHNRSSIGILDEIIRLLEHTLRGLRSGQYSIEKIPLQFEDTIVLCKELSGYLRSGNSLQENLEATIQVIKAEKKTSNVHARQKSIFWWRGKIIWCVCFVAIIFLLDSAPQEQDGIFPVASQISKSMEGLATLIGGSLLSLPAWLVSLLRPVWITNQGRVTAVGWDWLATFFGEKPVGVFCYNSGYLGLWRTQWTNGISTKKARRDLLVEFAVVKSQECTNGMQVSENTMPIKEMIAWTAACACLLGPKVLLFFNSH